MTTPNTPPPEQPPTQPAPPPASPPPNQPEHPPVQVTHVDTKSVVDAVKGLPETLANTLKEMGVVQVRPADGNQNAGQQPAQQQQSGQQPQTPAQPVPPANPPAQSTAPPKRTFGEKWFGINRPGGQS